MGITFRWRSLKCTRKFLITAVVVTAIGLLILMGMVERILSEEDSLGTSDKAHSSINNHKTLHDSGLPGTVVAKIGDRGISYIKNSLFSRILNGGDSGNGVVTEIITLNMSSPAAKNINCFLTKTQPSYQICPHPTTQDRYISTQLTGVDGTWQPRTLALLPVALKHYPSSTLLDIGAHIGVFSLLGARLGVSVVAVEPVWTSAVNLHSGAVKGNVSSRVKIVLHPITHHPMQVKFKYKEGNLGGTSVVEVTHYEAEFIRSSGRNELSSSITLDSLAPFVNTSNIILKIDTEGRECEVISSGRSILTSHFTPYIFMEWSVMANNRNKYKAPCTPEHIKEMVEWLSAKEYLPYISKSGAMLNPAKFETWRAGDIFWRHSTAPNLFQVL